MLFGAHVSSSGGIWQAIDRGEAIGCDAVQVFTQSPRMWRPTNHTPEAVAQVPRAPRGGRDRQRRLPRALSRQPRLARSGDLREVDRGDARLARGGGRDRRRGRHLPRRLAPRRRLRGRARAGRARAARAARADDRRPLAADGELGRHRRHDRALDRRARRDLRRARPPSATRRLPRLVPLVRVGRRRHRQGGARRSPSPTSTARSGSTGCAASTSTTRRSRSARTATGTTRSASG